MALSQLATFRIHAHLYTRKFTAHNPLPPHRWTRIQNMNEDFIQFFGRRLSPAQASCTEQAVNIIRLRTFFQHISEVSTSVFFFPWNSKVPVKAIFGTFWGFLHAQKNRKKPFHVHFLGFFHAHFFFHGHFFRFFSRVQNSVLRVEIWYFSRVGFFFTGNSLFQSLNFWKISKSDNAKKNISRKIPLF